MLYKQNSPKSSALKNWWFHLQCLPLNLQSSQAVFGQWCVFHCVGSELKLVNCSYCSSLWTSLNKPQIQIQSAGVQRQQKKNYCLSVLWLHCMLLQYLDGAFTASFLLSITSLEQDEDQDCCQQEDKKKDKRSPRSRGQRLPQAHSLCRQQIAQTEHVAQSPPHWGVPCLEDQQHIITAS